MLPQIKLFTVLHKESPVPSATFVTPIAVGSAILKGYKEAVNDDTGDNIAYLNSSFSELTACYWIWKNIDRTGIDAWGLCHYRRYFTQDKKKLLVFKKSRFYYTLNQKKLDKIVNKEFYKTMQALLNTNDVILQRPTWAHKLNGKRFSIKEAYCENHHASDWEHAIRIILQKFPDYERTVNTFENKKKMSYYNMMVARWEVWDKYFTWLFQILFEVFKNDMQKDEVYQQRAPGFLAERLLNLYVQHNQLRSAYLPVALFEKV